MARAIRTETGSVEFRELPVRLTEHDLVERGEQLVQQLERCDRLKSKARRIGRLVRSYVRRHNAEAARLQAAINTREEPQSVKVSTRVEGGEFVAVREDTGEIIERREATGEEMQRALPFVGPAEPKRRARA